MLAIARKPLATDADAVNLSALPPVAGPQQGGAKTAHDAAGRALAW